MTDYQTTTNTVYIIENGAIKGIDYHELVLQYAEKTTTPIGVGTKYHVREEEGNKYEGWTWGQSGQFPHRIETFETKEAAETWLLDLAEIDFFADDMKPEVFQTEQEAQDFLKSIE